MATQANIGRTLLLTKGAAVIAGLRNVSLSWGGESIDITTTEDAGQRLLLAASSQEQIDISADGITKGEVFRLIALVTGTSKMITDMSLEFPIGNTSNATEATLTGDFRLVSYEESGSYQDAVTFSISLQSSGAWTYTAETT